MNKVYACSDLHGRYDLWKMIDDFTDDTDKIYVLGDCGDRGPEGWRIIKEVYNSPKTIMLKGNHEDMLVNAMLGDTSLCFYNGGRKTFSDWNHEPDRKTAGWSKKLHNLPSELRYHNTQGQTIILCHAGYTPHEDSDEYLTEEDMLWDRSHFNQIWDEQFLDTIMVHGHSPIPYMDEFLWNAPNETEVSPGVFWYCEASDGKCHKVNIDCGAYFTGHTALLNLDTWEQHIFMAKDCIYEN